MFDVSRCKPEHLNFIYHSWIRTLRDQEHYRRVDKNWLSSAQHALITRLIQSPDTDCYVAHPKDDADTIYGYVVGDCVGFMHFVYVKEKFRRLGIARELITTLLGIEKPESLWVTEITRDLDHLQGYNPQLRTHRLCETAKIAAQMR